MPVVLVPLSDGARKLVEGATVLGLEIGTTTEVVVELSGDARLRLRTRLEPPHLFRQLQSNI